MKATPATINPTVSRKDISTDAIMPPTDRHRPPAARAEHAPALRTGEGFSRALVPAVGAVHQCHVVLPFARGLFNERKMLAQFFLQVAQIRPRLESG